MSVCLACTGQVPPKKAEYLEAGLPEWLSVQMSRNPVRTAEALWTGYNELLDKLGDMAARLELLMAVNEVRDAHGV